MSGQEVAGERVSAEERSALGRGFIEETFWLIGHLINIEEHLFESGLVDQAALIRDVRRGFVEEWARALNLDEQLLDRDWCVYKHLLSLLVHIEEVATSGEATMNPGFALKTKELYDRLKEYTLQLVEYHRRGGGGERLR
jgi:hypothetical protein